MVSKNDTDVCRFLLVRYGKCMSMLDIIPCHKYNLFEVFSRNGVYYEENCTYFNTAIFSAYDSSMHILVFVCI